MSDLLKARQLILNELATAEGGRRGGPYRYTFVTHREL